MKYIIKYYPIHMVTLYALFEFLNLWNNKPELNFLLFSMAFMCDVLVLLINTKENKKTGEPNDKR